MRLIWYVALGGAFGSAARYGVALLAQAKGGVFPLGTLTVNLTGSLLLGFILRYALDSTALTPELRALLATGFCGGYTTFSTFSYETVRLLEDGDWRRAGLYVLASVGLSLVGVLVGFAGARELLAWRRAG